MKTQLPYYHAPAARPKAIRSFASRYNELDASGLQDE